MTLIITILLRQGGSGTPQYDLTGHVFILTCFTRFPEQGQLSCKKLQIFIYITNWRPFQIQGLCHKIWGCATKIRLLISLSFSSKRRIGGQGPVQALSSVLIRIMLAQGPTLQSLFWYDNNKYVIRHVFAAETPYFITSEKAKYRKCKHKLNGFPASAL